MAPVLDLERDHGQNSMNAHVGRRDVVKMGIPQSFELAAAPH